MQVHKHTIRPAFEPCTLTIAIETPLELELFKSLFGATLTVPTRLVDGHIIRPDDKSKLRDIMIELYDTLTDVSIRNESESDQ